MDFASSIEKRLGRKLDFKKDIILKIKILVIVLYQFLYLESFSFSWFIQV